MYIVQFYSKVNIDVTFYLDFKPTVKLFSLFKFYQILIICKDYVIISSKFKEQSF